MHRRRGACETEVRQFMREAVPMPLVVKYGILTRKRAFDHASQHGVVDPCADAVRYASSR
ncbi:hypothetical protein D7S86_24875 [Pararobbsia silviterrae]|uniref:Uncharacterized protein n=1 Tax=Pararobbsia silviterrae TaxID=1792498 RepID=A0A494XDC6_9BURK|nr:hypothetical protein D7S86_24875 [Pararobbsia silviterrae]